MVQIWTIEGEPLGLLRAYGMTSWTFGDDLRTDGLGVDQLTVRSILERVAKLEDLDREDQEREKADLALASSQRKAASRLAGTGGSTAGYQKHALHPTLGAAR